MKINYIHKCWWLVLLLLVWSCRTTEGKLVREVSLNARKISQLNPGSLGEFVRKVSLDAGWKFFLGDDSLACMKEYDDSPWRVQDLPHDWSVEFLSEQKEDSVVGPFSGKSIGGIAVGQTIGGTGWYRKTFVVDPVNAYKRQMLYFEGVYAQSEIFVNGTKVAEQPYGYISFRCDITDYCLPAGLENVIAVRVKNEGKNSRWYAGSGIYRHVWLIQTEQLHLDDWQTVILTNQIEQNVAKVTLRTEIINESDKNANKNAECDLLVEIISPTGKVINDSTYTFGNIEQEREEVKLVLAVSQPELWSVETPSLYLMRLTLKSGHQIKDRISVPFGIRTLDFSAEKGFLLNGKSIKLKGGCVHHDNGLLGAASFSRAEERKVELLKANGYNAVRCSHNPPAEAFLNACDRLGLLVIDEAFDQWLKPKTPNDYHLYFEEWSEKDLNAMICRDRNHPSVIMWSIGNEIQERADSIGVCIAEQLKATVRNLDASRPVTAAVNAFWDNSHLKWADSKKAFAPLDIAGYNYMWYEYENDHRLYPERIMYGSETVARDAAITWKMVEQHPYIIGDFVWTAIDYLGESGIGHALELGEKEANPQFMGWPWFNAWCGDIDVCGDKKPQSYYRDVVWKLRHLAMATRPSSPEGKVEKVSYWGWSDEVAGWNWAGHKGEWMDVNVYTRYPHVKLFLNNDLVGEKSLEEKDRYTASFKVRYQQGELKAVALDAEGQETELVLQTTDNAKQLKLTASQTTLTTSPDELVFVHIEAVDNSGCWVSDCEEQIRLNVFGKGRIIGSGNASPTDMKSFRSLTPRLYRGRALVILQPMGTVGEMKLEVTSAKLSKATIDINIK